MYQMLYRNQEKLKKLSISILKLQRNVIGVSKIQYLKISNQIPMVEWSNVLSMILNVGNC